jgi:hypothetical protein
MIIKQVYHINHNGVARLEPYGHALVVTIPIPLVSENKPLYWNCPGKPDHVTVVRIGSVKTDNLVLFVRGT